MKDYYQILRISRLANATEIKRAYRRLAVVFHPDKNQSPQSSSLFQEINEAHEVLSDPAKRALYDQLLSVGSAPIDMPPPEGWHRDPAYRKRQQAGYRPRPPQPSERLLMMAHLLRYYRVICLIGAGWCAFLIFDYVLPFRKSVEKIIPSYEAIVPVKNHSSAYVIFTDKHHQFPVSKQGIDYFPNGANAIVVTSRLLNIIVRVDSQREEYSITSLLSIYQIFMFWPIILFLLSAIGLTLKSGIEFRFSIMVVICIFLFFNLIFLVASIL